MMAAVVETRPHFTSNTAHLLVLTWTREL